MNTVTKARPILFTGPMVRAILAGRKTQTRRVVKPQPFKAGEEWSSKTVTEAWNSGFVDVRCPFGNAGQRLWVRETWTWCSSADKEEERGITFKDGAQKFPNGNYYPNDHIDYLPTAFDHIKWHPSIYLPRWASRITLEVESIRIQRLKEISEQDALAEGISETHRTKAMMPGGFVRCDWPQWSFHQLWDSINEKRGYGWRKNPWVWVVNFALVDGQNT